MSGDLSLDEFEALFNAHNAGTIPEHDQYIDVFAICNVDLTTPDLLDTAEIIACFGLVCD